MTGKERPGAVARRRPRGAWTARRGRCGPVAPAAGAAGPRGCCCRRGANRDWLTPPRSWALPCVNGG